MKSREIAIDIYNGLEAIREKKKPCMRDDLYSECKAAHHIKKILFKKARRGHRKSINLCVCEWMRYVMIYECRRKCCIRNTSKATDGLGGVWNDDSQDPHLSNSECPKDKASQGGEILKFFLVVNGYIKYEDPYKLASNELESVYGKDIVHRIVTGLEPKECAVKMLSNLIYNVHRQGLDEDQYKYLSKWASDILTGNKVKNSLSASLLQTFIIGIWQIKSLRFMHIFEKLAHVVGIEIDKLVCQGALHDHIIDEWRNMENDGVLKDVIESGFKRMDKQMIEEAQLCEDEVNVINLTMMCLLKNQGAYLKYLDEIPGKKCVCVSYHNGNYDQNLRTRNFLENLKAKNVHVIFFDKQVGMTCLFDLICCVARKHNIPILTSGTRTFSRKSEQKSGHKRIPSINLCMDENENKTNFFHKDVVETFKKHCNVDIELLDTARRRLYKLGEEFGEDYQRNPWSKLANTNLIHQDVLYINPRGLLESNYLDRNQIIKSDHFLHSVEQLLDFKPDDAERTPSFVVHKWPMMTDPDMVPSFDFEKHMQGYGKNGESRYNECMKEIKGSLQKSVSDSKILVILDSENNRKDVTFLLEPLDDTVNEIVLWNSPRPSLEAVCLMLNRMGMDPNAKKKSGVEGVDETAEERLAKILEVVKKASCAICVGNIIEAYSNQVFRSDLRVLCYRLNLSGLSGARTGGTNITNWIFSESDENEKQISKKVSKYRECIVKRFVEKISSDESVRTIFCDYLRQFNWFLVNMLGLNSNRSDDFTNLLETSNRWLGEFGYNSESAQRDSMKVVCDGDCMGDRIFVVDALLAMVVPAAMRAQLCRQEDRFDEFKVVMELQLAEVSRMRMLEEARRGTCYSDKKGPFEGKHPFLEQLEFCGVPPMTVKDIEGWLVELANLVIVLKVASLPWYSAVSWLPSNSKNSALISRDDFMKKLKGRIAMANKLEKDLNNEMVLARHVPLIASFVGDDEQKEEFVLDAVKRGRTEDLEALLLPKPKRARRSHKD